MRKLKTLFAALIICCALNVAASAAKLSPALSRQLGNATNTASVGTVIISFNTTAGLNNTHLDALRGPGYFL